MKRYEALNSAFGSNYSLGDWTVMNFHAWIKRHKSIVLVGRYEKYRAWLNEDIDEIRHDKKGVCHD